MRIAEPAQPEQPSLPALDILLEAASMERAPAQSSSFSPDSPDDIRTPELPEHNPDSPVACPSKPLKVADEHGETVSGFVPVPQRGAIASTFAPSATAPMDADDTSSTGTFDANKQLETSSEPEDRGNDSDVSNPNQLSRPCAECRVSRVRCSREFPCRRCARLGLHCKLAPALQRGRPSKQARAMKMLAQAQHGHLQQQGSPLGSPVPHMHVNSSHMAMSPLHTGLTQPLQMPRHPQPQPQGQDLMMQPQPSMDQPPHHVQQPIPHHPMPPHQSMHQHPTMHSPLHHGSLPSSNPQSPAMLRPGSPYVAQQQMPPIMSLPHAAHDSHNSVGHMCRIPQQEPQHQHPMMVSAPASSEHPMRGEQPGYMTYVPTQRLQQLLKMEAQQSHVLNQLDILRLQLRQMGANPLV